MLQFITGQPAKAAGTSDSASSGWVEPQAMLPEWAEMYRRPPTEKKTLFELEAAVAKRMELLAWIDQLANSPKAQSYDALLESIGGRLPMERRRVTVKASTVVVLGHSDEAPHESNSPSPRRSGSRPHPHSDDRVVFDLQEDTVSHLLCRYAFCMSERWRKWFVKAEEMLLRARVRMQMARHDRDFIPLLMQTNGLPCEALQAEQYNDPRFKEYLAYRAASEGRTATHPTHTDYFAVPTSLATRLIKSRSVLCLHGRAILHRDQAQEVFVTVFRAAVNRGLHDAFMARTRLLSGSGGELATVTAMLDAFLEHYVADPVDHLAEGVAGAVRAGDIRELAQTHFPLCMRGIDEHLRRTGHVKHHGRFMYGLFLKAIGLSLDDAMELFASLMTEKGGGSAEAFSRTAYGYNIRHNYGAEGRKMSYSSLSCGTILALPPTVDKHDCHGCPFRFRNEDTFRALMRMEQRNPVAPELPRVRPTAADIEDIVSDCKGQHYTRACYKYFVATHPGCRRDTLFRSPYEYYHVSTELRRDPAPSDSPAGQLSPYDATPPRPTIGRDSLKRTMFTPTLKEGIIRPRTSPP